MAADREPLVIGSDYSVRPIHGQLTLSGSNRMPGEVNVYEPSSETESDNDGQA